MKAHEIATPPKWRACCGPGLNSVKFYNASFALVSSELILSAVRMHRGEGSTALTELDNQAVAYISRSRLSESKRTNYLILIKTIFGLRTRVNAMVQYDVRFIQQYREWQVWLVTNAIIQALISIKHWFSTFTNPSKTFVRYPSSLLRTPISCTAIIVR